MNNHQQIQNLLFSLLFDLKSGLAKSLKGNRFDLTPMHQKILAYICYFPGTTQQEIVDKTGRDKGQITRLLKELEKKGFIVRQKDEVDKRSFCIQVTEKGVDTFSELKQHEEAITDKLLARFTEKELEQLKLFLEKMRKNLV